MSLYRPYMESLGTWVRRSPEMTAFPDLILFVPDPARLSHSDSEPHGFDRSLPC